MSCLILIEGIEFDGYIYQLYQIREQISMHVLCCDPIRIFFIISVMLVNSLSLSFTMKRVTYVLYSLGLSSSYIYVNSKVKMEQTLIYIDHLSIFDSF